MGTVKPPSSSAEAVRPYLEGVAKNLAERIWGASGPAWGTTLGELEDVVLGLREILSEKLLELALQRQADEASQHSSKALNCPSCGEPTDERDPEPRGVDTRVGEANWQEPQRHCSRCRRAFFPSVQEPGH